MRSPDELGPAGEKLVQALGHARATELATELIPQLGAGDPASAPARYRFGELLTERPEPLLQVLGRCIRTQAILHGALRSNPGGSRR